jgi:branched-subunit amino acid aminotransferase/4-amino-4-deoxychorismate lyase
MQPAAQVLNYGQALFEGMKALKSSKDRTVMFRPRQNAKRMANGAQRMCMADLPEDVFLRGVDELVKANNHYVRTSTVLQSDTISTASETMLYGPRRPLFKLSFNAARSRGVCGTWQRVTHMIWDGAHRGRPPSIRMRFASCDEAVCMAQSAGCAAACCAACSAWHHHSGSLQKKCRLGRMSIDLAGA